MGDATAGREVPSASQGSPTARRRWFRPLRWTDKVAVGLAAILLLLTVFSVLYLRF